MYKGIIWNNKPVDFEDLRDVMGPLADMMLVEDEDYHHVKSDVSVTRLTSLRNVCPRKVYYSTRLPVYVEPHRVWSMNRGKLIHMGFKNLPNKEMRMIVGVRMSKSDPRLIRLQGIVDGYDEINGIIYEIKDTAWLPKEPRESHIMQLSIYAYMMKSMNMRVNEAILIYTSPKDFVVFNIDIQPLSEGDIRDLIDEYFEHKDRLCGNKVASWACDDCEYRFICKEADVTKKANMKEAVYIPPDELSKLEEGVKRNEESREG